MKIFGFEISRSKATPQPQPQQQEGHKSYIAGNYYQEPSALLTALGITAAQSQLISDPRLKLTTYTTMAAAFPEVSRMLEYHLGIMGMPRIESDDPKFDEDANAMLDKLAWIGQLDFAGNENHGLSSMVWDWAYNTMVLGNTFYSILDANGEPVLKSSQKVDKIQVHDSFRFAFNEFNSDKFQLQYTTANSVVIDKKITNAFKSIAIAHDKRFPWGKPLLYDAEYIAMQAAIKQEMQTSIYRETGASTRMTVMAVKPMVSPIESASQINILASHMNKWDEKAEQLRTKYSEMKQSSNQSGKATDLVTSIIGDIDISSHSSADNISQMSTYPEDIKSDLSRMVIAMKGVPELVGLGSGGDGLGSARALMQMDGMQLFAKQIREKLEFHIRHIFEMKMVRESKRLPPKYWIEWDGLSTHDLASIAEYESKKATTQKTNVDSMLALLDAGEIAAAQAFAKQNEIEWAIDTVTGATL